MRLQSFRGRANDAIDQCPIIDPPSLAEHRQVRVARVESGEWICLHEMGAACVVGPQIDASAIPATKGAPCFQGQGFTESHFFVVLGPDQSIFDQVIAQLLVLYE